MSGLVVHNTLGGSLEEFAPAASPVTMYVCGPTVYGEAHVGNARPVVVFDLLHRLLRHDYGAVRYARNITDIDDKIIAAAAQEGVSPAALAARYEDLFLQAARALGTEEPAVQPRATENIAAMVELAEALVARGHAYEKDGHLLFEVGTFDDYGALANRSRDEMVAGARVEVAPYKRDPGDFVLWKPSEPEQPGWDSPWGRGRPGWHLECSAMIRSCLGATIDIHGGGGDLCFPHHENEIAQSRCALGTPALARYWLHNGQVTLAGSKMAKSAGNIFKLSEALAAYPGEVVRHALLSAHYRRPLDWTPELVESSKAALLRFHRVLADKGVAMPAADAKPCDEVLAALRSDLNTPQAYAVLHELAAAAYRSGGRAAGEAAERLAAGGRFMGLLSADPQGWLRAAGGELDAAKIEALMDQREQARKMRDYELADRLRALIEDEGAVVEDSAGGASSWRGR